MFLLAGCGSRPDGTEGQKPVLRVNDLKLTTEDLQREVEMAGEGIERPSAGEPEWLSRVIERELIVQEGRQMGLDREPEFMRSIERFWKEALLKQVVRRKAREISAQVQVYEPEIEEHYRLWLKAQKAGTAVEPLETKRPEIERAIRQQKEADAMEQWVTGLRARAKIEVDHQALEKLR